MSHSPFQREALPLEMIDRVDEICSQFEADWQSNRTPNIEGLLCEQDAPERSILLAELLKIEWHYKRQYNATFTQEEYEDRFPAHTELVAQLWNETIETLDNAKAILPETVSIGPQKESPSSSLSKSTNKVDRSAVPGYEILRELGRGGMGVVYKARNLGLNRVVALKMILSGAHAGSEDRERFLREAEVIAPLQHANIVQIFEIGEHDGQPFLSLEYCDGGTLADQINDQLPSPKEAARIIEVLARAIGAAHEHNVVHRDLKPGNVLRTKKGMFKITDFGLAKRLDLTMHTGSGCILGTPSYMAPEQVGANQNVTFATDIYGLGAILYELLTGRPPFKSANPVDTVLQVVRNDPVAPRRLSPSVPKDLETICLRCLEKQPHKRYANAQELADDLKRFQKGEPVHARPVGMSTRVVKWTQRRPAIAILTALAIFLAITGFSGVFWQWRVAVARAESEAAANQQAQLAQQQAETARSDARRSLYAAHMNQAGQAWRDGHYALVREILDHHRPNPGEEDLRGFEWYHLWQKAHADWLTLRKHKRWVRNATFSHDGKRLATASYDNTVRIWDAATGRELKQLHGHKDHIHRVVFHPNNSNLVVSAGDDKRIRLWDASPKKRIWEAKKMSNCVWAVDFSPDGQYLAGCAYDGRIHLWDTKSTPWTLNKSRTYIEKEEVGFLAFSPDGTLIAVASELGFIYTWHLNNKTEHKRPICPDVGVLSLAFSPGGKWLACGCADGVIRIVNTTTWEVDRTFTHTPGESLYAIAFSPSGDRLVTGCWDGTVKIWDFQTGLCVFTLRGHLEAVKSVEFSPDGDWLVTASRDGTVKLWPARPRQEIARRRVGRSIIGPARLVSQAQGAQAIAITGGALPAAARIVVASQTIQTEALAPIYATCVAASASGGKALTIDSARQPKIWSLTEDKAVAFPDSVAKHIRNATVSAFSPAAQLLITADADGFMHLWDIETAKARARPIRAHEGPVELCALTENGKAVATWSSTDNRVRFWDLSGESPRHVDLGLKAISDMRNLALSPNGSHIALVYVKENDDDRVLIWNVTKNKSTCERAVTGEVMALAFSPNGGTLATAGVEKQGDHEVGVLELWDAKTGRPRCDARRVHLKSVLTLAFAPDGKTLATGDAGGVVKLWDASNGEQKMTLKIDTEAGQISHLLFSKDETVLLAVLSSGWVHAWPASTEKEVFEATQRMAVAYDDLPSKLNVVRACWGRACRVLGKEHPDSELARSWLERGRRLLRQIHQNTRPTPESEQWREAFEKAIEGR